VSTRHPGAKRVWVLGAGGALTLMLALMMAAPEPASASMLHTPVAILGFDPAEIARKVISAVIDHLFGLPATVTTEIVQYMVGTPNYADAGRFPELGALRTYIASAAWAILTLTFTGAALRYWAAGFTATSSGEAVASLGRSVAAAGALVAYPEAFGVIIKICNLLADGILEAPGVHHGLATMLAVTFLGNAKFAGLAALAGVFAAIVLIGLVITKIVLSMMLAVLYVAAPLVIVLWPLGALAWLPVLWVKGVVVICIWPVIWAICFAVFAVVGTSAFALHGGVAEMFFSPFIGLAALVAAFKMPQQVARSAIGSPVTPRAGHAVMRIAMVAMAASRFAGAAGRAGPRPNPNQGRLF
jgi:hypothetical protein